IAYSGSQLTGDSVRAALGAIDRGIVDEFIEAIGRRDAAAALAIIERLSEAGTDLTHFSREALSGVRDAMVYKAAGREGSLSLGLSADETATHERLAALFSDDGLLRLMHAMLALADRIRREEQPRFLLEASALGMIRLVDLTPIEDLMRRLEGSAAPSAAGSTPPAAAQGQAGSRAPRGAHRTAGVDPDVAAPRAVVPPPSASRAAMEATGIAAGPSPGVAPS